MFDPKDQEQYKKLDVSPVLKHRILEQRRMSVDQKTKVPSRLPAGRLIATMAAVAVVCVIGFAYMKDSMVLNMDHMMMPTRTTFDDLDEVSLILHLEVESRHRGTVSVSDGQLSLIDSDQQVSELRFRGKEQLVWLLDACKGTVYELRIDGRESTKLFQLTFDTEAGTWQLLEDPNNPKN